MQLLVAILRHLSWLTLARSILEALGVLWLFVEPMAFFSPAFSDYVKPYWWVFLLLGTVAGVVRALPRLRVIERIPGTDCSVELRVCDILSLPEVALIAGTNSTFDTATDDGTISPSSVQGQITKQYWASPTLLDRDITHALTEEIAVHLTPEQKSYGKTARYEIGTVAALQTRDRKVYLVAIAHLNAYRVAQGTKRDLTDALPRLWEAIRTKGGLEKLCTPILGSGFSRLDATREDLVREIIRSFIPAVRAGAFCQGLVIAISPQDFSGGHVNLNRLGSFLQHECSYGSSSLGGGSTAPLGTPTS